MNGVSTQPTGKHLISLISDFTLTLGSFPETLLLPATDQPHPSPPLQASERISNIEGCTSLAELGS